MESYMKAHTQAHTHVHTRTESFISLLLLAAILLVSANGWMAFRSVQLLGRSGYWVAHTWQVINSVERVLSSVKDAESGNRGYLLTGNPAYLEPYLRAQRDLPSALDTAQRLTPDNPRQQQRIAEMRTIIGKRLALLQQEIDRRRSGDADGAHLLVVDGTGKAEMDRLRALTAAMQDEERQLLTHRTNASYAARRRARTTVLLASIFDLALLVLLFWTLRRERLQSVAALEAQRIAEAASHQVQVLNAELEERVRLRTAELEATNRELEAFSYSVSHDLRSPLRTVDGFSMALEEDYKEQFNDEARDYLRRIRAGVQRMGSLIDALLQLSRITRAEMNLETVNLNEMAAEVARELRQENPDRNLTFHIQPGLEVTGDSRLLRIALENLLGNAVKFTSKRDHAVIEVGQSEMDGPGKTGEFYIRDNGAGFDMQYADKLFTAFQRLHGEKDFKGSGIGLATVSRIIRRHRGAMRAEGQVGSGATFWFTLG